MLCGLTRVLPGWRILAAVAAEVWDLRLTAATSQGCNGYDWWHNKSRFGARNGVMTLSGGEIFWGFLASANGSVGFKSGACAESEGMTGTRSS